MAGKKLVAPKTERQKFLEAQAKQPVRPRRELTPTEMVNGLLNDIIEARRLAEEHRATNQDILAEQVLRDGLVKEAEEALRDQLTEMGTDFVENEQMEATVSSQDRGSYDPEALPPHIRDNPEITKLVVDKTAMKKAIKTKRISAEEASAAWVPKLTKPILYLRFKETGHD